MTVGVENNDYPPLPPATTGAPPSTTEVNPPAVPVFQPAPLSLKCWPLKHRPVSAVAIFLAIVAFSLGLAYASSSLAYGLSSVLILVLVLWRIWVPVTYRIGANGIVQTIWGRDFHIAWRAVGSVRYAQNACVLYRASFAAPFASLQTVVLEYGSEPDQPMSSVDVASRVHELVTCYAGPPEPTQNTS